MLGSNTLTPLKEVNNSDSRSEIRREKIEGTPFEIITSNEKHFMTWGKFRLTDEMENKEGVLKCLNKEQWSIIIRLITSVVMKFEQQKAKIMEEVRQMEANK